MELKPELDISDKELFASATSDAIEPEPAAETPPAPITTDERPRDENGRFTPKEEKPAEVVAQQPEVPAAQATAAQPVPAKADEAMVPSWRLREVREESERRLQEMEARLSAIQRQPVRQEPAPPPPNVFENPEGYQAYVQQTQAQALATQRYEFSELMARQAHGDAKVDDAEKWATANIGPAERARIANSRHPYAELIKLKDERATLAEIGTDPKAYVQKKLDEALNDPAFLARAIEKVKAGNAAPGAVPATNIVQLPPSINRATSAASPHDELGDMSEKSLFAYATSK